MIDALRNKLRRARSEQAFNPGPAGLFLNPFFFARRGLYDTMEDLGGRITGRTLDVGCGVKPYEHLFPSSEYIGLEIDNREARTLSRADYYYDGSVFPFSDGSFDSLVVNQVLEHVFTPGDFVREISRVLRPGGILLISVPFVWDEHMQPCDFARYSSFGLRYILETHDFHIIEHKKTMNDIRAVLQLLNAYVYKTTLGHGPSVSLLTALFVTAPVNILGQCLFRLLPSNDDLYLDGVVLALKGSR